MGVSTTTNRVTYSGDGVTLSFSFPYYFFAQADLKVKIYNELTGAVTAQVLGVDYTITGTPTTAGLYPSGGSVLKSVAPTTDEKIVIYRDGVKTQTYALLENGQISSSALVQQLDYITLILQRLQDQASRSVLLNEGLAETFDPTLPADIVLNGASKVPTLNSGGTGFDTADNWPSTTDISGASASATAAAASATAAAASAVSAAASDTASGISATAAAASAVSAAASAVSAAAAAASVVAQGPFTIADNNAVAADITNFKFLDTSNIGTFALRYSRGTAGGVARLVFYKDGAGTWVVAPPLEDGDPSGMTFTLVLSGLYQQVQYVSDNTGAGTAYWVGSSV